MNRFDGKVAFVTGAASGIGAATAELLREEGATVVSADVTAGEGIVACDVRDPAQVKAAVDGAVAEHGRLDIVCNIAGVQIFVPIEQLTMDEWRRHIDINLTGPMLVAQAAVPHLRATKGVIVNVASVSSFQGQPYNVAYCASKGGVLQLTRCLAVELAKDGIRVSAVAPGGVDTPLSTNAGTTLPPDIDASQMYGMMGVLPGMMPPHEIAEAIGYLASAPSVTGEILVVDKGVLAK